MKLLTALLACVAVAPAFADTYVQGYARQDGTYVAPHYRSDSNAIRSDNYSSQGNTNPYTGQRGYERNEYSNPPAYNQQNPYYVAPAPNPYQQQYRSNRY